MTSLQDQILKIANFLKAMYSHLTEEQAISMATVLVRNSVQI